MHLSERAMRDALSGLFQDKQLRSGIKQNLHDKSCGRYEERPLD